MILSPHFDDAVLSCWSVLTGPEPAVVVNVYTGAPEPGSGAGWWDRLTGATDSAERMDERRAEDRAALAYAGCEALELGLLEAQYREGDQEPRLADVVAEVSPAGARLFAPAALGTHADHRLVRDTALALREQGTPVTLYADLPHAIEHGWPTWVADGGGVAAVDAGWAEALRGAGVEDARGQAQVRALAGEGHARKLDAVRMYPTQLAALDELAFRSLQHPETLRYEVFWPLG